LFAKNVNEEKAAGALFETNRLFFDIKRWRVASAKFGAFLWGRFL
jgi:hypothetical protein